MSGDWRADLRLRLEDFIDNLVVRGAKQSEVFEAVSREIEALKTAYEKDPDPADDESRASTNLRMIGLLPIRKAPRSDWLWSSSCANEPASKMPLPSEASLRNDKAGRSLFTVM
jgi:hypothetical protein